MRSVDRRFGDRRFLDRRDAGRQLAGRLVEIGLAEPLLLALPRGGVPVAYEIAVALGVPFEVFVARKIGAPGREELGIAAVAEGLDAAVETALVGQLGLTDADLDVLVARERKIVARRVEQYRAGRAIPALAGHDVVLVDDGLATGVTAEAALRALRRHHPRRLLLAVPVCSADTAERLRRIADDVVCVCSPEAMYAVGRWYGDFTQTSDAEVIDLLERGRSSVLTPGASGSYPGSPG